MTIFNIMASEEQTRGTDVWRPLFCWLAVVVLTSLAGCQGTPQKSLQVSKDIPFTEFFRRTNGWVAGDGAMSVPLSDGRTLWLFGDSHANSFNPQTKTVPCLFQSRNAAMVQKKGSVTEAVTLIGPGPGFKSLFKQSAADDPWYWPLLGFQEKRDAYVYLTELRKTGPGTFGFANTGHDCLARLHLPDLTVAEYLPLPAFKGRGFGLGFVREKDGFIYTFGSKGSGINNDLFVARFKPEKPNRDWTFWDGHNWRSEPTNVASIFRTSAVSLSVCKVRDKYLLIGSALSVRCDMGREIFVSTSDNPTGPFSPVKRIYTIDDTVEGHFPFFYLPMAHPQFINRRDELLITYSINGYEPCLPMCTNGRMNPDHYRPRAIRVPLKLIDPEL